MHRFLVILFPLLLTACGFTLDKPVENHLPDQMALVTQRAGEFEKILQQTFSYQGTQLITDSTDLPLALVVKKQQQYDRYVGNSSMALTIEITVQVNNSDGKLIVFPQVFVKEATVQFNANDEKNKRLMIDSQRTQLFSAIARDIYDFLTSQNLDSD
ncbi:hypothetical protein [Gynuella sunshinyii]|uniref:LPS-assembly lipoprotein LptE n=1 Tax=Gynuella sunshinyii YC6258 TaxID=1445510 RepID=A0A0C5VLW0_9GAMM|nr:hypothetical protein [Gynuella sunshinyii]AJQ95256.1 hypothetical Protein YC6258_03220 [Gynuella sunshinyii YC6258]